jgi:hypothetical protein
LDPALSGSVWIRYAGAPVNPLGHSADRLGRAEFSLKPISN